MESKQVQYEIVKNNTTKKLVKMTGFYEKNRLTCTCPGSGSERGGRGVGDVGRGGEGGANKEHR